MKNAILSFLVLLAGNAYAQPDSTDYAPYLGKGSFLIKGKVENKTDDMKSWGLAVTDYLTNEAHTVPVADDGSFEMEIPITDVQDIYLYLGGTITIFSYPGDTIEMCFDKNNIKNSFTLKGKNPDREKELALCMLIHNKYRRASNDINNLTFREDIADEELVAKLNEYYDNKIEAINSFEKENGQFTFLNKFRDETYFQAIRPITNKRYLIPKIHCQHPDGKTIKISEDRKDTVPNLPYETLSDKRFRMNKTYRSFLNFYVSSAKLKFKNSTPSVKDVYYFALSCLSNEDIRDWYITQLLDEAFTYSDFNETSFVYEEFKKICQNKDYLNLLERKCQTALRLQPGNPAPDFELKDINGQTVKLSDFRGKVVYIDFWSRSCPPCVQEFKNAMDKFREAYKDFDITYIYINVNDNEAIWKKAVAEYNLQGINLIAEGWEKNPVYQAYNVMGIPHYVLIDKEGKIVTNKCDRPSIILMLKERSKFDQFIRGETVGN